MAAIDPKYIIEAALLSSSEPLGIADLRKLFSGVCETQVIEQWLFDIQNEWSHKGLELLQVASGWRFQTRKELQVFVERLQVERPQRYSRAVLETLAIIAYQQPVTRGDIEAIRGVSVASNVVKTLEERGWIEVVGYRDAPGRPSLLATTQQFLDDLGLKSLQDLPELESEENVSHLVADLEKSTQENVPDVLTMGMALTAENVPSNP